MKKTLAIVLALCLVLGTVFVLAGCGKGTDEPATEVTEETTVEETGAPIEETTVEETTVEETTEETTVEETTEATKGLNSTNVEEVVAYYVNAALTTAKAGAPTGQQKMVLDGEITGDGFLGAALKVANPIITSTLEKQSNSTDYIPGVYNKDDVTTCPLTAADVSEAKAESKDGVTTITLTIKSQTDGPDCDAHTAGPVARACGTIGSVDVALEALGAEISSGRDTISLNYNTCTIKCKVNEETGKITSGTWRYKCNIKIVEAAIKLGIAINAKNLKACIDWSVNI